MAKIEKITKEKCPKEIQQRIDSVLSKHQLKKTALRRNILSVFLDHKRSLTQAEIITALSNADNIVDRVSIYRNLANLKDAGILHEVDANHYVFCSHECEAHAHLLLFCQQCHKHQEIKDHERITHFMSAVGIFRFFGKQRPIFLRGVCSSCTAAVSK